MRGPVPIAVSIGAATHPTDGRTATDLIAAADRGLYRVKRSGRKRATDRAADQAPEPTAGPAVVPAAVPAVVPDPEPAPVRPTRRGPRRPARSETDAA
jgi:hypothetical protein